MRGWHFGEETEEDLSISASHFISLGRQWEDPDPVRQALDALKPYQFVTWGPRMRRYFPRLSTEDLVCLTRGMTLAETVLSWSGGSMSGVISAFKELQRRGGFDEEELVDWILQRTNNRYVPYGVDNVGRRSYKEYWEYCKLRWESQAKGLARQILEEEGAAIERKHLAVQRRQSAIDRNHESRNKFINQLSKLSLSEQIKQLVADDAHSVEFYPTCLAGKLTSKVIADLPADTKTEILRKLKGRHRGSWGRLKKRLLYSYRRGHWKRSAPWDRQPW